MHGLADALRLPGHHALAISNRYTTAIAITDTFRHTDTVPERFTGTDAIASGIGHADRKPHAIPDSFAVLDCKFFCDTVASPHPTAVVF